MTSAWDDVRTAIAAKLTASVGLTTAGLRRALADVDEPVSMPPEVRILQPSYRLEWQTGVQERYQLDIPFELVVTRPNRRSRSNPVAAIIARAIQVEWQSGYTMALGSLSVIDGRLLSMEPGLVEFDAIDAEGNPVYDGYRGTIQVDVLESVTRTA
jgi:hypothetical protein